MADETTTVSEPTPSAAPEPQIKIDVANVLHNAERATRHALSHLEDEFIAECHKVAVIGETEAKKLLAWLASKV